MKKIGFKYAGAFLSMLLMNVSLAADPMLENATAPSKDNILTPGAKVIAGLPGKNDFYILGQNEKMPTELTDKAKADIAAKKAQVAQQKAKSSPIEAAPAVVDATSDALTNAVVNPALNIQPAAQNPLQTNATQNDKAVTSMKKASHRPVAANKQHGKSAYLNKIAQKNKTPKYLQKVAKNKSSHTVKHTLAAAKSASHITKHTLAAVRATSHTKYKFASKTHSKSLLHQLRATA